MSYLCVLCSYWWFYCESDVFIYVCIYDLAVCLMFYLYFGCMSYVFIYDLVGCLMFYLWFGGVLFFHWWFGWGHMFHSCICCVSYAVFGDVDVVLICYCCFGTVCLMFLLLIWLCVFYFYWWFDWVSYVFIGDMGLSMVWYSLFMICSCILIYV